MAVSSRVAKQLCTKPELALFTESLARHVKAFDEKALKSRVARSRKLRDKYRQLANRQDREARGKQSPRRRQPSRGSDATRKKEQIFAESLSRFEKQLAKLTVQDIAIAKKRAVAKGPEKKRATSKRKTPTTKKTAKKQPTGQPTSVARRTTLKVVDEKGIRKSAAQKRSAASAKKTRIVASGLTRKQKHRSAENRRHQARRDNR